MTGVCEGNECSASCTARLARTSHDRSLYEPQADPFNSNLISYFQEIVGNQSHHGFHTCHRWLASRAYSPSLPARPIHAKNLHLPLPRLPKLRPVVLLTPQGTSSPAFAAGYILLDSGVIIAVAVHHGVSDGCHLELHLPCAGFEKERGGVARGGE